VTICTYRKECVLGSVGRDAVRLTAVGRIARDTWFEMLGRIPTLVLDTFVVMPNHVHGLVAFVGAGLAPPGGRITTRVFAGHGRKPTLSDVVCVFKSISTRKVNACLGRPGKVLWQRGYYEHVVRDGEDVKNIQRYILENPLRWGMDRENPSVSE
jgi:putative transposase